jgi:hypothetical protein
MRILFTVIGLLLFSSISNAEIYVCLDKETGEPKGMVDIKPDTIGDWAKKFTMKQTDESYRGKAGHEIKIEDGKIRHATETEIADYKKVQAEQAEVVNKENALKAVGLTSADIEKIKKLKDTL